MSEYQTLRQFVEWVNAVNKFPDDASLLTFQLQEYVTEKNEEIADLENLRVKLQKFIDDTKRALNINKTLPKGLTQPEALAWVTEEKKQSNYLVSELAAAMGLYTEVFKDTYAKVGEIEEFFERRSVKLH